MKKPWRFTVFLPLILACVLFLVYAEEDDLPPLKTAEDVLREQDEIWQERMVSMDDVKRSLDGDDDIGYHIFGERQNPLNSNSRWWFANIFRNGTNPYFYDSNWVLFRNVKAYGAIGNGVANDTKALQDAMDFPGNRCHGQYTYPEPCESRTTQPALVYIPPGTYIVTSPIIMRYNTMVIGDALTLPTIKAHPTFSGIALLDANPYYPGDYNWYANQNNMWRQVRNLILDITVLSYSYAGGCIHWQVAQATNMQNIVMNARQGNCAANKQHGIFMDNGSGGFMRDLIMNGGGRGALLGNQQFTSTNMTINDACVGIYLNWDWMWSFRDLKINRAEIGIDMPFRDKPAIGHAMVKDSKFTDVKYGVVTTFNCSGTNKPASVGSLLLQNVDMTGTQTSVAYPNGTAILPGGVVVDNWMQGNTYSAYYAQQTFPEYNNQTCWIPKAPQMCVQGSFAPPPIPQVLKAENGAVFDRGKPQYNDEPLSAFVSVKANGCIGDGLADDTDCLNNVIQRVRTDQIVYIDHGGYRVTRPIKIPKNIRILGEFWPKIFINNANGFYSDPNNPVVAFQVGEKGDVGNVEIVDVLFETRGPTPGAILMEWNLKEQTKGSAGMWDTHWRLGGSAGTLLQDVWEDGTTHCAKNPNVLITTPDPTCYVSFLILHITNTAELYMENNWGWVSDHDLDTSTHQQINIWQGRGLLVESVNPVWILGGSFEHCTLYNYMTRDARNLYMGHIQSETAYMQSNPDAVLPYPPKAEWDDPDYLACKLTPLATNCVKTWGLRVIRSDYIFVYGAGLYSFFVNYDAICLTTNSCQQNAVEVSQSEAVYLFGIYTVGTENMVMMDQTRLIAQGMNGMSFGAGVILFEFP